MTYTNNKYGFKFKYCSILMGASTSTPWRGIVEPVTPHITQENANDLSSYIYKKMNDSQKKTWKNNQEIDEVFMNDLRDNDPYTMEYFELIKSNYNAIQIGSPMRPETVWKKKKLQKGGKRKTKRNKNRRKHS